MNALKRYSVLRRFICLFLLLFVSFNTAQNSFGVVEEGHCDDINELVGYGVIGETSFQYGNNSEINSNTITYSGNTPTPDGNCETIDFDFPPIDPEIFPETGSTDLKPPNNPVAAGKYGTIEFEAKGKNDTVTFSGGDYYIKELIAKKGATVQLAPGDYFIEKISFENKSEITIVPSGQVNLYIKESLQGGNQSKFNSLGDTGDFIVFLYDSASFQIGNADQGSSNADFNGIIYSPGASSSIQFGNNTNITGAILSAGSVEVGNNTEFDYATDVQSEILDALGCEVIAGPDHIRIEHTGSGLTCQRSDVALRACADADCTSETTYSVTLSMTPASSNSLTWIGGDIYTFTGNRTIQLRQTVFGPVTLGLTNANPAPTNGYRCYNSGVEGDCGIDFYDSGFLVSVPDLTSCQSSELPSIQAVRKGEVGEDAEACVADGGFTGQLKTVGFWFDYLQPDTGSEVPRLNGTALETATPGTDVELRFNDKARSTFALTYDDAGQLQLNARYQGSGEEVGLIMIGNDSFVVAPHSLRVQATSDGATPLDNTTSSGTSHWPAGKDFALEVAGVCSDGTVTTNFAADTKLSAVAPFAPVSGVLGTLSDGLLVAADYSSGVAQDSSVFYSEVGTVTVSALATDYLDSGIDVIGSSVPVGRFTPHHFAVSLTTPQFAAGCATGSFSYLGQPFDYAVAPVVTVFAQNKQNVTTVNYSGDWWKITSGAAGSLTGKLYSAAAGTVEISNVSLGDPAVSVLGGGIGLLTFDVGDGLFFERSDPQAPFDAEISLAINVLDSDGIAYTANPVHFGEATAGNGMAFDAGKEMRWGRLIINNAFGSELLALDMPMRAEYFDGTAFIPNNGDTCTSLPLTQLILNNGSTEVAGNISVVVGSGSDTTSVSLSNPFSGGDANLRFSPPGADGFVDVTANLSLLNWLRYDWDGDGNHDDNPLGRATFGLYKGRPGLIYLRETYR